MCRRLCYLGDAGWVAGLVDGWVAGGRGWTVSHMESVDGISAWADSLAKSKDVDWANGPSGSVPRSMRRIGIEAALASAVAARVRVTSPPFSPIAALLEVRPGGRSVANATR